MINDPIADMLTRMRNAVNRGHKTVSIPASKLLESIAKILEAEGFINGYIVEPSEDVPYDYIVVSLKYVNGESAFRELKRISKPGLRIYKKYKDIIKFKGGLGISIVSTSKGLMTGKDAVKEKIGGELLATIW